MVEDAPSYGGDAPTCSSIDRRWPKMGPRWPKMTQDGPRWAQDGPRWPKMGPRWPKMGPRRPKMSPRWPKMGPSGQRWAQNGNQDGPKMGPKRPSKMEVERGSALANDPPPLGSILGLSWELIWASYGPLGLIFGLLVGSLR